MKLYIETRVPYRSIKVETDDSSLQIMSLQIISVSVISALISAKIIPAIPVPAIPAKANTVTGLSVSYECGLKINLERKTDSSLIRLMMRTILSYVIKSLKWNICFLICSDFAHHPLFTAVLAEEKPLVKLLVEAGGKFPLKILDRLQLYGVFSKPFEDWLKNVVSTPRSLFSTCRLAVRKQLLLASEDRAIGERVGCLCLPRQQSLLFEDEISCVLKRKEVDDDDQHRCLLS